ncbi:MAG: HDOD domain-containing protein [Gammaproteobacteria bacterium]|nr:HDOD domain-containing protein [Gammaproteobacteria bacterium]
MGISEAQILDDLANDKLTFPTLPEVAIRVRDSIAQEDVSVKEVSDVIETDPVLAGRIIQVANSALYRGARAIENVNMAVGRLGLNTVRNLATSLVMKQLFQATHPVIDTYLRELWEISTNVAALACALASIVKLDKDTAMLAGLVHAIGVSPILLEAENDPEMMVNTLALDNFLMAVYPTVSAKILQSWDFPAELITVSAEHLTFTRDAPSADYTDLITVALLQTVAGTKHPLAATDLSTVNAFERLGMPTDIEQIELQGHAEIADEIKQAIA